MTKPHPSLDDRLKFQTLKSYRFKLLSLYPEDSHVFSPLHPGPLTVLDARSSPTGDQLLLLLPEEDEKWIPLHLINRLPVRPSSKVSSFPVGSCCSCSDRPGHLFTVYDHQSSKVIVQYRDQPSRRLMVCPTTLQTVPDPPAVIEKVVSRNLGPSRAESLVRRLLDQSGLRFLPQFKVDSYSFDFCLPDHRTLIEIDGAAHRQWSVQKRDWVKSQLAQTEGWKVLRFPVNRHLSQNFRTFLRSLPFIRLP